MLLFAVTIKIIHKVP